MSELNVEIISPEKPLYSGKAIDLIVRAWDGEIGILPGHAPLMTRLGIGEVRMTRMEGGNKVVARFAINRGYMEVGNNSVVILSEKAHAVEDAAWASPEAIARLEKELAETIDLTRRDELKQQLEWMHSVEKLQAHTKG